MSTQSWGAVSMGGTRNSDRGVELRASERPSKERPAMTAYRVCQVLPNGIVMCTSDLHFEIAVMDPNKRASLQTELADLFPGDWGVRKIELALKFLTMLGKSKLPELNILNRTEPILASILNLLATEGDSGVPAAPPSILLFNFTTLPAVALGPWVLAQRGLPAAQDLYAQFPGGDPS